MVIGALHKQLSYATKWALQHTPLYFSLCYGVYFFDTYFFTNEIKFIPPVTQQHI